MDILFFRSQTFLTRELKNAFGKRPDCRLCVVDIPRQFPARAVPQVLEQIRARLPALIVSVNDAGFDFEGRLAEALYSRGCILANWYHDDPFYEQVFFTRRVEPHSHRIDFVSEASFVAPLMADGREAVYLPLATDPAFFHDNPPRDFLRDIAFVGNSSINFLDSIISENVQQELAGVADVINELKTAYARDPSMDTRAFLLARHSRWHAKVATPAQFIFAASWMVEYLYRRDFIVFLSERYGPRMTIFGDPYWSRWIRCSPVSTGACYYDNLCDCYQQSRINLNLNRVQIRTSFTQRVFDCLAAGAFLLTPQREQNRVLFTTSGPSMELAEFSTQEECVELVEYYLSHEEERKAIARRGQHKVLAHHTYDKRVQTMLAICRERFGL